MSKQLVQWELQLNNGELYYLSRRNQTHLDTGNKYHVRVESPIPHNYAITRDKGMEYYEIMARDSDHVMEVLKLIRNEK